MYKIGSFNCLSFGRGASKDDQKFADIFVREEFDIIALQEIKGQKALERILQFLPSHWRGIADDGSANDYAFVWNSRRFELANAYELGMNRIYAPRIYKQYRVDRKSGQKDLVREPFFARFFPTGGAAPYIEIRLINTHIRYSKGSNASEDDPGAIAMRRNEFDVLTKAIYAKEADKRYGNNRPAYTILLGDYNLNIPSSEAKSPYLIESFEIIDGKNVKIMVTAQKGLSTLRKNENGTEGEGEKKYGEDDGIFANNYDHFTFDVNRFGDSVISCNRINTVEKYFGGETKKHLSDVSDHVPVVMNLNIRR